MLNSRYETLGSVAFPPFMARQVYMYEFDIADPVMPEGCEDYVNPVRKLLAEAGYSTGRAYVTIDEKALQAGETQRKPGPHVDGRFDKTKMDWTPGGGGWNHSCNIIGGGWPVIVAASDIGCKVFEGDFDTEPQGDGDMSHAILGEGVVVSANRGYLLSPDCVHESLPMERLSTRQFLRIALEP